MFRTLFFIEFDWFSLGKTLYFIKSIFLRMMLKKHPKSTPNRAQIESKSMKYLKKLGPKAIKIDIKRDFKRFMAWIFKITPQNRKNRKKWRPRAPKRKNRNPSTGYANPSRKELRSSAYARRPRELPSNTLRGRGPPRIVTPSELARQRGGPRNERNS